VAGRNEQQDKLVPRNSLGIFCSPRTTLDSSSSGQRMISIMATSVQVLQAFSIRPPSRPLAARQQNFSRLEGGGIAENSQGAPSRTTSVVVRHQGEGMLKFFQGSSLPNRYRSRATVCCRCMIARYVISKGAQPIQACNRSCYAVNGKLPNCQLRNRASFFPRCFSARVKTAPRSLPLISGSDLC